MYLIYLYRMYTLFFFSKMTVNLENLMAIAHSLSLSFPFLPPSLFVHFFFCSRSLSLVHLFAKSQLNRRQNFADDTDTLMNTAPNIYTIHSANFFTYFFLFFFLSLFDLSFSMITSSWSETPHLFVLRSVHGSVANKVYDA